jgi:hypothetical protein
MEHDWNHGAIKATGMNAGYFVIHSNTMTASTPG